MLHDEKGYIQFHCDWEPAESLSVPSTLIEWRNRLRQLGLLGVYPDGIGYGNVSIRTTAARFLISGTATGHLSSLTSNHFAEVTEFDIDRNSLRCRGPVKASSESLSHASVYVAEPAISCVIHVHHFGLWERYRDRLPTTDHAAEAGTPAMAWAIEKLLQNRENKSLGLFIMGGHREGIMSFGASLEEAGSRLLRLLET